MGEIVRFDHVQQRNIEAGILQEQRARLDAMDAAATAVVNGGGKCDDMMFMTAFFGGFVDAQNNWDTEPVNARLLARDVEPRVAQAFAVGKVVSASVGEPFLRGKPDSVSDPKNLLGIVMPGSRDDMSNGLTYRIAPGGYADSPLYRGAITFDGYEDNLRNGDRRVEGIRAVPLLTVERHEAHLTVMQDASPLVLGTAAVREALGFNGGFYGYNHHVEKHIQHLRAMGEGYIRGIKHGYSPVQSRL
jgi:hypothetical protein